MFEPEELVQLVEHVGAGHIEPASGRVQGQAGQVVEQRLVAELRHQPPEGQGGVQLQQPRHQHQQQHRSGEEVSSCYCGCSGTGTGPS